MGDLNELDDLFKNNLSDLESEHSTNVWANIESGLNKQENDKNKLIIFRLRFLLGGLITLIGVSCIYYFANTNRIVKTIDLTSVAKTHPAHFLNKKQLESSLSPLENNRTVRQNSVKEKSNNLNSESNKTVNFKQKAERSFLVKNKEISTGIFTLTLDKNSSLIDGESKSDKIDRQSVLIDHDTKATVTLIPNSDIKSRTLENNLEAIDESVFNDTLSNQTSESKGVNSIPLLAKSTTFQNEDIILPLAQNKSKFYLMGFYTPEYLIKYARANTDKYTEDETDELNEEITEFSYNTGLLLGYDFSKHLGVKLGVAYSFMEQGIKPRTVYADLGSDGLAYYHFNTSFGITQLPRTASSSPNVGDSLAINTTSFQSLHVINIPVFLKYEFLRKKMFYYGQLGLSANYMAREVLTAEIGDDLERVTKMEGLNDWHFGGSFSMGIGYNINNSFSFVLEPGIRGAFTPINKNTPIITRPITIGLLGGIIYRF